MRLGKSLKVWLIVLGAVVFTAGSVQAGGVIEEWVARYNGPGNYNDEAKAIAIDSSGNIYVTGISYGSGDYYDCDYATIKYDSAGNELWVRRYNGPGNSRDEADAIAVDSSGNIYVTGQSYNSSEYGDCDYATIKYDPNGNQLWVARYNGLGNYLDWAHAIAVDSFGNIYVTGESPGSGPYPDYATIKYNSDGNELWVARYNGPGVGDDRPYAIAIDGSGNIYVTGNSWGGYDINHDYATIKYDSSGNELWVRRYNGPGNGEECAYAIAVDGSGNIYVTGFSAASGSDQASYDYATIKYDPNGNQLWVRGYNGPGNDRDYATAIAVDGSGNIYVTGWSSGSGTYDDYATIKYDTNGNELWVRRYNGPGNYADYANAIAVDNYGNIYVTGYSSGFGANFDYATIKYDPNGNEIWVRRYNVAGYDRATAIAIDGFGNVYVTGYSAGSGTYQDYATIKYSQHPVILTMQTLPPEVNTVLPSVGQHIYPQPVAVDINAQRFIDCPDVYVFDHWEGDVNDPNSANTTVLMDNNKTVTAVFVDGRQCGDECHPYPAGDLDKDCVVTFGDFALFASHWLDCTKPECD
jgi:uncharacterized delta-60 repeat protein